MWKEIVCGIAIVASAGTAFAEPKGPIVVTSYAMNFARGTEERGHYDGDNTPVVEWVGDIDGDGKMDVLLNLPDDNCGFDERLYLSSQSGKGELLHEAAQLSGSQAACGC